MVRNSLDMKKLKAGVSEAECRRLQEPAGRPPRRGAAAAPAAAPAGLGRGRRPGSLFLYCTIVHFTKIYYSIYYFICYYIVYYYYSILHHFIIIIVLYYLLLDLFYRMGILI